MFQSTAYAQNSKKSKSGISKPIQPLPQTDIYQEDKIREEQERYKREEERMQELNVQAREESYKPLIMNMVYKYLLPVAVLLIMLFSTIKGLNIKQRIAIPFVLLIGLYLLGSLSIPIEGSVTEYFENTTVQGIASIVISTLFVGGSIYFLCEMPLPTKNHKIFLVLLTAVITGLLTLILTNSIILTTDDYDIEEGKSLFMKYPFNLLGFVAYNGFLYYRVFLSSSFSVIKTKST